MVKFQKELENMGWVFHFHQEYKVPYALRDGYAMIFGIGNCPQFVLDGELDSFLLTQSANLKNVLALNEIGRLIDIEFDDEEI